MIRKRFVETQDFLCHGAGPAFADDESLSAFNRMDQTCIVRPGLSSKTIRRTDMPEFTLRIDNMHCGSCIRRVSQALASTEGVQVEEVRLGAARLSMVHDTQAPAPVDLAIAALAKAGFPARLEQ
jgi:Cu+-exporting ATPase